MRSNTLTKLLFLLPLLAQAADEFTVYMPKYRSTEELVGLAESAFSGKATFSSINGKVVINASPKTTASVLKLFGEIDMIARQYKISFRLVAREESSRDSISFKDGQVVVRKNPSVSGTLSAGSGRSEGEKEMVQSAQLMEGREAQMTLGNDWFPGGFSAKARGGAGDLVTVEFRQREPGAASSFSLQSEVLLRLGEWKAVGEAARSKSESQAGILQKGSSGASGHKTLQVKLELAK